jgi:hypothetical protein
VPSIPVKVKPSESLKKVDINDRNAKELIPFISQVRTMTNDSSSHIKLEDLQQIICPEVLPEEAFKRITHALTNPSRFKTTLQRFRSFNEIDHSTRTDAILPIPFFVTLVSMCTGNIDDKITACFAIYDESVSKILMTQLRELLGYVAKVEPMNDSPNAASSAILSSKSKIKLKSNNANDANAFEIKIPKIQFTDEEPDAETSMPMKAKNTLKSSRSMYDDLNEQLKKSASIDNISLVSF